jgi:hypothetical protein
MVNTLQQIKKSNFYYLFFAIAVMLGGCKPKDDAGTANNADALFTLLPAEQTNVNFSNNLTEGLTTVVA